MSNQDSGESVVHSGGHQGDADLSIGRTHQGREWQLQVNPGDTIRYTITYRNDGDADAAEVVIGSLVDREPILNGNRSENLIGWPLDTVAPGSEGTVHFDVILSNTFRVATQRFTAWV